MLKLRFIATALAISALAGLANVQAQQSPPGQPDQLGTQTDGTQTDQSDRYEARRAPTGTSQQAVTIKEAIVQKLRKSNDAEIELAKLAQQKSDNEELKQLTQMMIQDHQAMNQELQQFTSHDQTSSGQSKRNQSTDQSGARTEMVPQQLCQISDQASQNALRMTKEMLNKYQGQDFNMAFLGQQSVAHTMLLAELKAIESTGPQELQPIVQKAIPKVEQHLEKAKQLAKKLQDDQQRSSRR